MERYQIEFDFEAEQNFSLAEQKMIINGIEISIASFGKDLMCARGNGLNNFVVFPSSFTAEKVKGVIEDLLAM